ncbi:4Fe-4S ferredoxin [Motiliproteus coralliicola]|uniref:4Fe-4S ferredoxin n=1 Tax=Motiliproteus coralliicola TaxID=2283196 RepID=A0A369WQL1_9GAMM|nr:4Fe-4S binding protein [Motiliproteus coralliicola]RDE22904.1 4Fe-4S ferredoxin [Motiliproteus coralliicola]
MSVNHNDKRPAAMTDSAQPSTSKAEDKSTPLMTQAMSEGIDADQQQRNRQARSRAMAMVSPAINLAAPGVEFSSKGRLLILGAEHRIRMAADVLSRGESKAEGGASITALVTEAMPQRITIEMEQAAELAPDLYLYRLALTSISGYLGQFAVLVDVDGTAQNLATLAIGTEQFDLVLDLSAESSLPVELKPAGYFHVSDDTGYQQALAELPQLSGSFDKPRYFQVNPEACALTASNLNGCNRCLDVCAADAISVIDGRVQIDAHLCHGVGACATVCPTSAIRYGFPRPALVLDSLQRLMRQYREQGGTGPQLLLHDAALAESGQPSGLSKLLEQLPGHYLPLQLEEVASAGLELWLSAIALGAQSVTLLASKPLPEATQSALAGELDTANRLLEGLSLSAQVRCLSPEQLLSEAGQTATGTDTSIEPMAQIDLQADKRQQISSAMSHLYQQQLDQQAEVTQSVTLANGAPFGNLELVEQDCTLCMSCVTICPAKALTSASDTPRLSFNEDACVQCGLCTQACPESVLNLQPRYLLEPETRTRPRVLKEEQPFHCIRCNKPFATQSVVSLMIKKLAGHSMFDEAGLKRLEMCQDCRVIDMVQKDPGGDLFEYAKGREQHDDELNLTVETGKADNDQPLNGRDKNEGNVSSIDSLEVH